MVYPTFYRLLLVGLVAIFLFVRVPAGVAIRRFLHGRRLKECQGPSYRERPPALYIGDIPEGLR